jgi:hypothetical protein
MRDYKYSLACHVRRTVSALGCLECAAPTGGRGRRDRGMRASNDTDCSDGNKGGKASGGGTSSNNGGSRSSSVADVGHVARAAAAELEALYDSSTNNSVFADNGTNDKLRLAREATRAGDTVGAGGVGDSSPSMSTLVPEPPPTPARGFKVVRLIAISRPYRRSKHD